MCIDPLDATFPAGFADFLESISATRPDGNSLLLNSVKLYKRALKLDPFDAEYALKLGKAELALFVRSESKDNSVPMNALDYFKLALKNDPNGINTAYEVGNGLMGVWKYLDHKTRDLVIERLRFTISQNVWLCYNIYPWAWQNTKDFSILKKIASPNYEAHKGLLYLIQDKNLYQFLREESRIADSYRKKQDSVAFENENREKLAKITNIKKTFRSISPVANFIAADVWYGKSSNGDNEYRGGDMYGNGTIYGVLEAPAGRVTIIVQAKGSPADGIYPYMIVELDGEVIGETFVNNDEWKEYTFAVNTETGKKVLSITFCNDAQNIQKNEDRNLYIGEARIVKNE